MVGLLVHTKEEVHLPFETYTGLLYRIAAGTTDPYTQVAEYIYKKEYLILTALLTHKVSRKYLVFLFVQNYSYYVTAETREDDFVVPIVLRLCKEHYWGIGQHDVNPKLYNRFKNLFNLRGVDLTLEKYQYHLYENLTRVYRYSNFAEKYVCPPPRKFEPLINPDLLGNPDFYRIIWQRLLKQQQDGTKPLDYSLDDDDQILRPLNPDDIYEDDDDDDKL